MLNKIKNTSWNSIHISDDVESGTKELICKILENLQKVCEIMSRNIFDKINPFFVQKIEKNVKKLLCPEYQARTCSITKKYKRSKLISQKMFFSICKECFLE